MSRRFFFKDTAERILLRLRTIGLTPIVKVLLFERALKTDIVTVLWVYICFCNSYLSPLKSS